MAVTPGLAMAVQLLPLVSVQDIYQMAAAKAQHDYELDKLFNPEYYGDGSGICPNRVTDGRLTLLSAYPLCI